MEITMSLSDHRDLATVLACYREVRPEELRAAMGAAFRKPAAPPTERKRRKAAGVAETA